MKSTDFFSQKDCALFKEGKHFEIYDKLGSHRAVVNGQKGFYFAVWAPDVNSVSLVGTFNNWDYTTHVMTRVEGSDVYEIFTSEIKAGEMYKYAIKTMDNQLIFKADPYASRSERRPGTASIVDDTTFKWSDRKWQMAKEGKTPLDQPISIYEIHPGSWRLHRDEMNGWHFNYKELAAELAFYVKNMGYTHVEFMGIPEYPMDKSWGYKVTGYYAPTSRYGTPEEFAYLVNSLHNEGIGVILDWSPSFFANDSHGLADFNGKSAYEYQDPHKRVIQKWDARVFDYTRNEVRNFLIANALYWIEKFHIDGLKVNSISTMIFLNYERKEGQYSLNEDGSNENIEALSFLRDLNTTIAEKHPGVIMIADESCAYKKVTHPVSEGGLGFTFKWKSIWMDEFLHYMSYDSENRKKHHEIMTKGITFNGTEDFILPISHEDITHEKSPLYQKMPGNQSEKVANMKVTYAYLFGQPGKKHIFMGQDFGQHSEWNDEQQLDWFQQAAPEHKKLRHFVRDLHTLYKKYGCMYNDSLATSSFTWLRENDAENGIVAFTRTARNSGANLLFVINFQNTDYKYLHLGVPSKAKHTMILDESGLLKPDKAPVYLPLREDCDGQPNTLTIDLPAYGVAVFKY